VNTSIPTIITMFSSSFYGYEFFPMLNRAVSKMQTVFKANKKPNHV